MITIIKDPVVYGILWVERNLVKCPICGVVSNLYPAYKEEGGTAVVQRLTYCGHRVM